MKHIEKRFYNIDRGQCMLVSGVISCITENGITDGAAIAGTRAAAIYGMKILARHIEDNKNNYTRFFILAKQDSPPSGNDKTSIVFSAKHKPGALYECIEKPSYGI